MSKHNNRILIVDLNNFAHYPTLAVGLLIAILRQNDFQVKVFSPLSVGIKGIQREPQPAPWGFLVEQLRHWSLNTRIAPIRKLRTPLQNFLQNSPAKMQALSRDFESHLNDTDAVLISTYLMYFAETQSMIESCRKADIPVLLGGSYFFNTHVAQAWLQNDSVAGLVGGEVETELVNIVADLIARKPLINRSGVWNPITKTLVHPKPLRNLDDLPFPDYTDFPWALYPNKIIPIITGRGCGWGVCSFCSDVVSSAGRTFRSRTADNVLAEIVHQHQQHDAKLFVFTDLKLNSNPAIWQAIVTQMRHVVPAARWVGAIHIGKKDTALLDRSHLQQARQAGMVRLTTGLESGSQQLLDRMRKGTHLSFTSQFLRDAHASNISVRTTMIVGYPGETASDLDQTRRFVEQHTDCIDRIQLNRLSVIAGTPLHKQLHNNPAQFPDISIGEQDLIQGINKHTNTKSWQPDYRRSFRQLLRTVHHLNCKPLPDSASDFEGVM